MAVIIFGDTEILCSFRLVLEGKAGKQTPELSRFLRVRILIALLAYASLAASRTLLQRLLSCLNFTFKRFISCYKRKK